MSEEEALDLGQYREIWNGCYSLAGRVPIASPNGLSQPVISFEDTDTIEDVYGPAT